MAASVSPEKCNVMVQQLFSLMAVSESTQPRYLDENPSQILNETEMAGRLSASDRLSLIFDFPLRSCVLIAQVKANIWVRNGFSMRSQAANFKDLSLRDCDDANIHVLQFGAICLGSELFLTGLVDRFELVQWFQGETSSRSLAHFDQPQLVSLAESMLSLLVTILTERSMISGASLQKQVEREIIHYLACHRNGIAYSSLVKRVSDCLMEEIENKTDPNIPTFDEILLSVADFKFPDGSADHGVYALKDFYFQFVDTWFWHYTGNERDDVEDILRSRVESKRQKKLAVPEEEIIRPPSLMLIKPGTGVDRINDLIDSKVFVQIVFMTLWNVTRSVENSGLEPVKSDSLLSHAVHLLMIAFCICETKANDIQHKPKSSSFLSLSVIQKHIIPINGGAQVHPVSLLELVLGLVDRANEDDIKEQAYRLRYLVKQFEKQCGPEAQSLISGWRDKSNWHGTGGASEQKDASVINDKLTEQEKKKLASKARQAAIMAQFTAAQKSFVANYGDDIDELDDDDIDETTESNANSEFKSKKIEDRPDSRPWNYPTGTCIICQEDLDKSHKMYGMMSYLHPTAIRRQINFADANIMSKCMSLPNSLDTVIERHSADVRLSSTQRASSSSTNPLKSELAEWSKMETSPLKQTSIEGVHVTSCGHLIHFGCFQTYADSIANRHHSQPTRNHPESLARREFLCPVCKSLENCVIPIIRKSITETVNWSGCSVPWREQDVVSDETKMSLLAGWLQDVEDQSNTIASVVSTISIEDIAAPDDQNTLIESGSMDLDAGEGANPTFEGGASAPAGGVHSKWVKSLASDFVVQLFKHDSFLTTLRTAQRDISASTGTDVGTSNYSFAQIQKIYNDNFYRAFNIAERGIKRKVDFFRIEGDKGLEHMSRLWDTFAYTVASVEISCRGNASLWSPGAPISSLSSKIVNVGILNTINPQTLTHLRILSSSVLSSIMVVWSITKNKYYNFTERFLAALVNKQSLKSISSENQTPALLSGGFSHLVALSMIILTPATVSQSDNECELFKFIRLMWIFELVRCVTSIIESILIYGDEWIKDEKLVGVFKSKEGEWTHTTSAVGSDGQKHAYHVLEPPEDSSSTHDLSGLVKLIELVAIEMKLMPSAQAFVLESIDARIVKHLFESVGLVFARRCVILLYARFNMVPAGGATGFGVDLNESDDHMYDDIQYGDSTSELERLCSYLRLPSVASLFSTGLLDNAVIKDQVKHWVGDFGSKFANHYGVVWCSGRAKQKLESPENSGLLDPGMRLYNFV